MDFGDKRLRGRVEDVPIGAGQYYSKTNLNDRLPRGLDGYELVAFEPKILNADPVVLRNRWGQIVYQWPDDFVPAWVDVLKVCKELGLV